MKFYKAHCQYGYYCKEVSVMVNGALSLMPYAQAGYVVHGDVVWLVSYESFIFGYNRSTGAIHFELTDAAPDYSRTTAKHVGAFCKEFCPQYTYHDIKRMYYEQDK